MRLIALRPMAAIGIAMLGAGSAFAEPMTVDEFRRELVGVPLCGTPTEGPLAGQALCTVYLPDGTAVLAGSGILVRGVWEAENGQICRRGAHDVPERRRCVAYEQIGPKHYRNSDGVEVCVGPCHEQTAEQPASPGSTQK